MKFGTSNIVYILDRETIKVDMMKDDFVDFESVGIVKEITEPFEFVQMNQCEIKMGLKS